MRKGALLEISGSELNFNDRLSVRCGSSALLCVLFLVTPVIVQSHQASFEGLPILVIEHRSNSAHPLFSGHEFSRLFRMRVGDIYSSQRLRHAVAHLYQAKPLRDILVYAENVNAGPGKAVGLRVEVVTVPKARLSHIVIRGNEGISTDRLHGAIGIAVGSTYAHQLEQRVRQTVESTYRQSGYFQASITTELKKNNAQGDEVALYVRVTEGEQARIDGIQFHGSLVLAESTLRESLHAHIGGTYDADTLRDDVRAIRTLYQSEGFFDVTIGLPELHYNKLTGNVSIRIWIDAGMRVEVRFTGNASFPDSTLLEPLTILRGRTVDQQSIETAKKQILAFYHNAGHPFVNVDARFHELSSVGLIDVQFVVDEGIPVALGTITLTGNHAVPTRALRKILRSEIKGWFSRGTLQLSVIDEDEKNIAALYRQHGFMDVQVRSDVRYSEHDGPTTADLRFTIAEGVQTVLADITIDGNASLSHELLYEDLSLRPGMAMTMTLQEEGRDELLRLYANRGYPFTEIEAATTDRYAGRGVVIHYRVKEGIPVSIGAITFEGNVKTADHVIARELLIKPGDPVSPDALAQSQARIERLEFLENVSVTVDRPNILEETKNVTVAVDERPGGAVEFGVGFGDVEGARGFVDVSHENVFGTGRTISARAEVSQIEQRYALRYREPRFLGQPIDAVATVSYLTEERVATDLLSFDRLTIYEYRQPFGTAFGFESRLSNAITIALLYRYEIDDIFKVRDEIITARREAGLPDDTQKVTIASLMPSIIWDTRNDPFNPTRGAFHALTLKQSASVLGSEDEFYKFTGQSAWFTPIGNRVVLALQGRGGYTERFGNTSRVAIVERFFLGGRNTVRGYDQDSLGVTGQTLVDGIPTGGNAMLVTNAEFRFALPRDVGLVLFVDGGNVWRDARNVDLKDIKFSMGPGIRYNTPVGPLRLDLGYKLRRETGESAAQLHFTLGHAF